MPFLLALLSFLSLSLEAQSPNDKLDKGHVWIGPVESEETRTSELGVVYGTRNCGGPGRFLEMRFEGCQTTRSFCRLPADSSIRRSEMDFATRRNIRQLGFKIFLAVEGASYPLKVYDRIIESSNVTAGTQYTIHISGADHALQRSTQGAGSFITRRRNVTTAQYVIYRVDNGFTEVCGEADFVIF